MVLLKASMTFLPFLLPNHLISPSRQEGLSNNSYSHCIYDCSCHESSYAASLNDCLEVGPPFLNDLCSIFCYIFIYTIMHCQRILRRHFFMSDYTKMTETLLISCGQYNLRIRTVFHLTSVPFGTTNSPFMLHATIDLHLHKFQSCASEDIQHNIYADNIISGSTLRLILCNTAFGLAECARNEDRVVLCRI